MYGTFAAALCCTQRADPHLQFEPIEASIEREKAINFSLIRKGGKGAAPGKSRESCRRRCSQRTQSHSRNQWRNSITLKSSGGVKAKGERRQRISDTLDMLEDTYLIAL